MHRKEEPRRRSRGWSFLAAVLALVLGWGAGLLRGAEVEVVPAAGGYLFSEAEFPVLRVVGEGVGAWSEVDKTVRWFDREGGEVREPVGFGRHGAYVEARLPDEFVVRRGITFFRFDPGRAAEVAEDLRLDLPETPRFGLSPAAWRRHGGELERFGREAIVRALLREEAGAILTAGLAEWDEAADDPLDTPSVRHQEFHLGIKRRVLGLEDRFAPFDRPRSMAAPAPVLREGTPAEAGLADGLPLRLREICVRWEALEGEPFTAVVARRGVVVFHEAFGRRGDQPVGTETVYPLLSITKTVAGVMVGLFFDHGVLGPDRPLGEILPDLDVDRDPPLTPRSCFMHVIGVSGQSRWGGLDNPWLENAFAHELRRVGPAYSYSGVAYDVVGMAMQAVAGKSVPRLFSDHLFGPLGMREARIDGLGIGAHLRTIDLAKIGQLIINRGAYGEYRFMAEETLAELMPQPYEKHFPGLGEGRADYGFGIRWASRPHPRARRDGIPEAAVLPGPSTLGHGSLSGTIFRVDPELELIVVVGRFRRGEAHGAFFDELLLTIDDALDGDPAP